MSLGISFTLMGTKSLCDSISFKLNATNGLILIEKPNFYVKNMNLITLLWKISLHYHIKYYLSRVWI